MHEVHEVHEGVTQDLPTLSPCSGRVDLYASGFVCVFIGLWVREREEEYICAL